jgi:SAM-dependent methyltransferase
VGARARDWAENEEQQIPAYEEAIRRVGIGRGQVVLDVGCGSGVFLRLAADHGAGVVGLDAAEVHEKIATEAGLTAQAVFEFSYPLEYPDQETLVRRLLSRGSVVEAIQTSGERTVAKAIGDSLAPYRTPDGGYRLVNEWHYLGCVGVTVGVAVPSTSSWRLSLRSAVQRR